MIKFPRSHRPVGRALATVVEPRIRSATAADGGALGDFLSRLSPDSSYQRFLTDRTDAPSPRLLAALLPESSRGGALLAYLGDELVGHGLWVRVGDASVAEIAIVVADAHQRRGIGTALAGAVTADLVAHGVADIEVFSGSDNRAVARMLARAAPDARRELDGSTTTWTFRALSQSAALPRTA